MFRELCLSYEDTRSCWAKRLAYALDTRVEQRREYHGTREATLNLRQGAFHDSTKRLALCAAERREQLVTANGVEQYAGAALERTRSRCPASLDKARLALGRFVFLVPSLSARWTHRSLGGGSRRAIHDLLKWTSAFRRSVARAPKPGHDVSPESRIPIHGSATMSILSTDASLPNLRPHASIKR